MVEWSYKSHMLSRVWLCDPINCSLSSSSVCGIFQARNMGCYKSSDQKEIYYEEVNNYKEVREAGAWGRGPLLQCFHLDKHLEQQNTPCILYWCKLPEPKNNCLHAQLGQIMNNKTENKNKNPAATSEEPGAKVVYCTRPQHTMGKTPKTPLQRNTLLLSPHIRNQLAPPQRASKQGNLLFVFALPCWSRDSNKALPEFLIWPLINFYWLRRPRILAGNKRKKSSKTNTVTFNLKELVIEEPTKV